MHDVRNGFIVALLMTSIVLGLAATVVLAFVSHIVDTVFEAMLQFF